MARMFRKRTRVMAFQSSDPITYHKVWGDQRCGARHWVIVGQQGDVYGCQDHIFRSTYVQNPTGGPFYEKVAIVRAVSLEHELRIETLEGPAHGRRGDWLVTNPSGEQYFVSDATFIATYEPLEDEDEPAERGRP